MRRYWKWSLSTLLVLMGCTGYYYQSNLNRLSPGMQKEQFLRRFVQKNGLFFTTTGAVVRAAKPVDGQFVEVVTVPLSTDGTSKPIEYWFVFKDAKLVQWGRPEDWKAVAATYQIEYNPPQGVRPPS